MKKNEILQIIAEQLNVSIDECSDDTSFRCDLGADSLDLIELAMEFEEKLRIEFSNEELEIINTIGQALDLLRSKGHLEE